MYRRSECIFEARELSTAPFNVDTTVCQPLAAHSHSIMRDMNNNGIVSYTGGASEVVSR